MSAVNDEIAELRSRLARLEAKVRLDESAVSFIKGDREIREGDFVKFSCGHATRVSIGSDGRWTYMDRRGSCIEAFRVPPEDDIERLYTIHEVNAIIRLMRET